MTTWKPSELGRGWESRRHHSWECNHSRTTDLGLAGRGDGRWQGQVSPEWVWWIEVGTAVSQLAALPREACHPGT